MPGAPGFPRHGATRRPARKSSATNGSGAIATQPGHRRFQRNKLQCSSPGRVSARQTRYRIAAPSRPGLRTRCVVCSSSFAIKPRRARAQTLVTDKARAHHRADAFAGQLALHVHAAKVARRIAAGHRDRGRRGSRSPSPADRSARRKSGKSEFRRTSAGSTNAPANSRAAEHEGRIGAGMSPIRRRHPLNVRTPRNWHPEVERRNLSLRPRRFGEKAHPRCSSSTFNCEADCTVGHV